MIIGAGVTRSINNTGKAATPEGDSTKAVDFLPHDHHFFDPVSCSKTPMVLNPKPIHPQSLKTLHAGAFSSGLSRIAPKALKPRCWADMVRFSRNGLDFTRGLGV